MEKQVSPFPTPCAMCLVFFGVFVWAFGATSNSMVSNVIGQGKKESVLLLINKIMKLSMSIAIVVCLLLNVFPALYLSIYGQDEAFIQAGIPLLRLITFVMILMSATSVWLNSVTGTGNSRITFLIELAAIIFYCIYYYYCFSRVIQLLSSSSSTYFVSFPSLAFLFLCHNLFLNRSLLFYSSLFASHSPSSLLSSTKLLLNSSSSNISSFSTLLSSL